jgi:hypothetical protein
MSLQTAKPPKTFTLYSYNIIVLDDTSENLTNFEEVITRYNKGDESMLTPTQRIEFSVSYFESTDAVIEHLNNAASICHAIICDYNLAKNEKGLEFILYLKSEAFHKRDIIYSLYTLGGIYNTNDLVKRCRDNDIIFSSKAESLNLILQQITDKLMPQIPQTLRNPTESFAIEILGNFKSEIVDKLNRLKLDDPDFSILSGSKQYKAEDIINEINELSDFGKTYISNFFHGLMLLKRK